MLKKITLVLIIVAGLCLLLAGCAKGSAPKERNVKLEGQWNGWIAAGAKRYSILVEFKIDNELRGFIDIPEQGGRKIPLTNIKYRYPDISFELDSKPSLATFEGKVSLDNIDGAFTQGSAKGEFKLEAYKPMDESEMIVSTSQEVELPVPDGKLFGTLEVPLRDGPHPVVLLIAGSGPTDRDGNSPMLKGKSNSLKMLARELAKRKIATLRYDKRGIGASGATFGNKEDLRFDHYINDAVAWMEFLKKDQRFFSFGILGHTEGSLIGMVSAQKTNADFFISLEGQSQSTADFILSRLAGAPEELKIEADKIIARLKAGEEVTDVSAPLEPFFAPEMQPYLISAMKYEPLEVLKRVPCPVQIVQGSNDLLVPVSEGTKLAKVREDIVFSLIPGMNNVLKIAPADKAANMATYIDPELPLAEQLVYEIYGFIYAIFTMTM